MNQPKVLAFAGSLRRGSYNKQLVRRAAAAAEEAGAVVTFVDLADYPLPVFDEDVEAQSTPEHAKKLKELMKASDGMLIASPEYNGSVSGALKNVIDWASRPGESEKPYAAFAGKVATVMAASPSGLGGVRGLRHLRTILSHVQMIVLPQQVTIAQAYDAFDEAGRLKDAKAAERVADLGRGHVEFLRKYAS
jgi:NAD(P)H-dependent FMN reductase